MSIRFNHTIVFAKDKKHSAQFLADLLGLPEPQAAGHFMAVTLDDGATLDYAEPGIEFLPVHIAFLVSENDFDAIYGRILAADLPYWAHPRQARPQEFNTNDGGRGLYFDDPCGHHFEIITRPYGSAG